MYTVEGCSVTELFMKLLKKVMNNGMTKVNVGNLGKEVAYKELRPVLIKNRCSPANVLMVPFRHNNPFAQAAEGLWTLAGRNDVEFMDHFNGVLKNYSDDGVRYRAAYGHRLIHPDDGYGALNQILNVIAELSNDWRSRRAVMSIWDPMWDNHWYDQSENNWKKTKTKDTPCNDLLMFKVVPDSSDTLYLDMTVINRSNDLILGLCNVNIVQFSLIHQFIATMCGYHVGDYYHYTDSLHIYEKDWELAKEILGWDHRIGDHYDTLSFGLGSSEFSEAWNQGEEPNKKIQLAQNYIRSLDVVCGAMNNVLKEFNEREFNGETIEWYMGAKFDIISDGYMYADYMVPYIWAYPLLKKIANAGSEDADTFYTGIDSIKTLMKQCGAHDWTLAGWRFIAHKFNYIPFIKKIIKNALIDNEGYYEFLENIWRIESDD